MDSSAYGWVGEALVSGLIVALCVQQLISVRRAKAKRLEREARAREALRAPKDGL